MSEDARFEDGEDKALNIGAFDKTFKKDFFKFNNLSNLARSLELIY